MDQLQAEEHARLSSHPRWVPASQSVTVRGRELGGMIYYGSTRQALKLKTPITACIDPTLPVARFAGDIEEACVWYRPTYADLTSRARAAYLDWLAGGREDASYGASHVLLYFYGLEHRFFIGEPDESEEKAILAEVERLLSTYGDYSLVRVTLTAFLEAALISGCAPPKRGVISDPRSCLKVHRIVRFAIGILIRERQPVTADWMLYWLNHGTGKVSRYPAQAAYPEFRALFMVRFEDRYPHGLTVEHPGRDMDLTYKAASGTFSRDLAEAVGPVPEIEGLKEPLAIATEIASGASSELDEFRRQLARNRYVRESIFGHLLLPEAIRPLFRCAELDALRQLVNKWIEARLLVKVKFLVHKIEHVWPQTVGKMRLAKVIQVLAELSVGMAPDPRFAIRRLRVEDPVALFRLPPGTPRPEVAGPAYRQTLLVVSAAALVAHADGRVAESERRQLEAVVDEARGLSESERARLRADIDWSVAVRPTMWCYRKRLRKADVRTQEKIARAAHAVAWADGRLDPREIRAIDEIYRAIGVKKKDIPKRLLALRARGETIGRDDLRPIVPPGRISRTQQPAQAVPTSRPAGAVELDQDRVSAIRADTDRVAAVLDEIFKNEDQGENAVGARGRFEPAEFEGLDSRHAGFVRELIARPTWTASDFAALAGSHGLMALGALETVNEWAFERLDDALIEENGEYSVNPEVAGALRSPSL